MIDDSPAPETSKAPPPPAHGAPAGQLLQQQPGAKRRRTGIDTAYDTGYYDRPSFSINPQQYGEGSSHSLSTDRTTSLHTTAPTSLGSQGSQGATNAYYEDTMTGQKRKRTTRKSARDEQKRKELETQSDAFLSYVPPPKPIIKSKDIPVPVIRDVSAPAIPIVHFRLTQTVYEFTP